jgi:hypothetical protein
MPSGGPSNPPQNVPPADATPNQAQQADVFDPTTAIATPVPPVSPPLPSLITPPGLMQQATSTPPPQVPPRRSARRSGVLWRAVLLVVLVALIVVGAGIWYSTAHFPGRRPDQRQSMSPVAGQLPLTSTAQGTAQVTASAMPATHVTPTGTTNGNAPVGATGTPTQAPKQTPTPAPDCLHGSSSHLTFTSVLGLGNPSPRTMTLTNCGGSTMKWIASVVTNVGGAWLSANPAEGTIAANGREDVQVRAAGTGLPIGIYKGSVTFLEGSSTWTVTVTYTISQA